jgi:hypothetical protein
MIDGRAWATFCGWMTAALLVAAGIVIGLLIR